METARTQAPASSPHLEWVDLCRGIVMVLVVVGHSTRLFNDYIYQFHVSAFFFLSGYTCRPSGKRLLPLALNRFFTLLLPFLSLAFLGFAGFSLLSRTDVYAVLFPADQYPGFGPAVRALFQNGYLFVQPLGATWFLPALFAIAVLEKILLLLTKNKAGLLHLALSYLLLLLGYLLIRTGRDIHAAFFWLQIILIGQFYYTAGVVVRAGETPARLARLKKPALFFGLLAGTALMLPVFAHVLHVRMDYPGREFHHPILDAWAALNGTALLCLFSMLLAGGPSLPRKALACVGRNSMGVLVFHFLWFKVCFVGLYALGRISKADILEMTAPATAAGHYWLPIAVLGVLGSLLTWWVCGKIPVLRFLLGLDKAAYRRIDRRLFGKPTA